jgi:hypothetical protein
LTCPQIEQEIDEGRKRIDLSFDNSARDGFFYRLHTTYRLPSQFIFAECKNYGREVGNPEIDQLAGRFGPNRGKWVCWFVEPLRIFHAYSRDAEIHWKISAASFCPSSMMIFWRCLLHALKPHRSPVKPFYRRAIAK